MDLWIFLTLLAPLLAPLVLGTIKEVIDFDNDPALRALGAVEGALDRHAERLEAAFRESGRAGKAGADAIESAHVRAAGRIERVWGRVKRAIAAAFTVAALRSFAGGLVGLNARLQETELAFGTMLGSAMAARRLLKDLFEFTETTPFQFDEVSSAARKLLAFGSAASDIPDELRRIGDVSAGIQAPIGEIAELYGKARVQGRLFAEDINQFTNRGVPIIQELARQFGVSESQVKKLVEQGRVGFPALERAFIDLTSEGGKLAGLTEVMSEGFTGVVSTLIDQGKSLLRDVGKGVFTELGGDLKTLRDRIQALRESGALGEFARRASDGLRDVFRFGRDALRVIAEYGPAVGRLLLVMAAWRAATLGVRAAVAAKNAVVATGRGIVQLYNATIILAQAGLLALRGRVVQARAAMVAFNTVAKANPLGILVNVLAAGAAALLLFRDRSDDAARGQRDLAAATREATRAIEQESGALLRQRQVANEARRAALDAQVASLEARRRQTERQPFEDQVRQGIGPGGGTVERVSGEEIRQGRLAEIDAQIAARREELAALGVQQQAIDRQLSGDLEKRLAFLEAERDALVAAGVETGRLRDVNQEITALQNEQERLRRAGLTPDGPGGTPQGQALEQARGVLEKIEEANALAARLGEKERGLLREVLGLQEEISQLKKAEKVLGREAVAEALAGAERRLAAARAALSQEEELVEKIGEAASGFSGLVARGLDGPLSDFFRRLRIQQEEARQRGELSFERGLELDPALLDAWRELQRLVARTNDDFEHSWEILGDIAGTVQGLGRLLDLFGDLGAELRSVIDGAGEALANLARLRELQAAGASGLALLPSGLGIASGVVSVVTGLIGAMRSGDEARRAQIEEMERLREALEDNARRIQTAIERLISSGRVGSGVSGEDAARAAALLGALESDFAAITDAAIEAGRRRESFDVEGAREQAFRSFLAGLEDLGLAELDGIDLIAFFDDLIRSGRTAGQAIDVMLGGFEDLPIGLRGLIEALAGNLGGFSSTVDGAAEAARFFARFMGEEAPAQFDRFLAFLLENVEGLAPELRALLEEAAGLDITTGEGRTRLREIIATIAAAFPEFLGGLTVRDLDALLEELTRFLEDGGGAVPEGESQSALFQRSITEVQAGEISAYLEEIAFFARGIFELLGGTGTPPVRPGALPGFGGAGPTVLGPGPLIEQVNRGAAQFIFGGRGAPGGIDGLLAGGLAVTVNVGGVRAEVMLSPSQVQEIVQQVGGEVMGQLEDKIGRFSQARAF